MAFVDEALDPDPRRPQSMWASLIAGSTAGIAQVVVAQPLDTIKTRSQLAKVGQFKGGALEIARVTIAKEGFLAFYKGMASPLLGVAAVNSLLFAANGYARKVVSPYPDLTISQIALAGGIAGAVQSVLCSPVEMFKIRMQGQYGAGGKRLRDVVGDMYREYGWKRGIMRGYWITVVKEIPAYGGFYAGYEFSKRTFQKQLHVETLPVWATLTAGAIGGLSYWTACYPLDVVKSRIQMADTPPKGFNYIFDTCRTIYQKEGAKAFVRGLAPTYVRAIPSAASTFIAFEFTMEMIKNHTHL